MAFIDNIRQLTSDADKVKDTFMICVRKQIEEMAKAGLRHATFSSNQLDEFLGIAKNGGMRISPQRESCVRETFDIWQYACGELRKEGFKPSTLQTDLDYVMFTITW